MTRIEITSKRKARAIKYLVDKGEYSAGFGSHELEEKHEIGQILDADYEPLAEYLDELINQEIEKALEEPAEEIVEPEEITPEEIAETPVEGVVE